MSKHDDHVTVAGPGGVISRIPAHLTRSRAFKIQQMRVLPEAKGLPTEAAPVVEDAATEATPARKPGRPKKQKEDGDQA